MTTGKRTVKINKKKQGTFNFALFHRRVRRFLGNARVERPRTKQGKPRLIYVRECFHLFLLPMVFIYDEILLRIFTETGVFHRLFYPVVFAAAAGFLASVFTNFFKKKINSVVTSVILVITAFWFTVEALMHRSYQVYMTFSAILNGADGVAANYSSELFSAVFHGLPVIIFFFLPPVVYIVLAVRKKLKAWQYKLPLAGILLASSVVLFLIGSLTAGIGSTKAAYSTAYEFDNACRTFGLITGMRLDAKYGGKASGSFVVDDASQTEESSEEETEPEIVYEKNEMDISALNETSSDSTINDLCSYVNSLTASSQNEYTGIFEGKNLIMICAEAYCDAFVDPELTPTLYRLIHNGIYFSDFYQPAWGGSTSTGEFSFLTGIAPQDGIDTMLETIGNNMYFTMGNQMQRLGYWTAGYHNSDYNYYDRDQTHENLGFGEWIGQFNGIEDICGTGYPSDSKMLTMTLDTLIDKQPFSVYYMTVTGHAPYEDYSWTVDAYYDEVMEYTGGKYKERTTYYICYQMELENALTQLIEKLEEYGIADDTVIALTGDHYPYGLCKSTTYNNSEDYLSDLLGVNYQYSWERDSNSFICWSGCLENELKDYAVEVSEPCSSIDIVPTLSNLFGLEFDSRLFAGRDALSDAEALVFWNNHSWVTSKGKYDAVDAEFHPAEGVEVDDGYVDRINTIVNNKIYYSRQMVYTDFWGYLFGEDTVTENPERPLPGYVAPSSDDSESEETSEESSE